MGYFGARIGVRWRYEGNAEVSVCSIERDRVDIPSEGLQKRRILTLTEEEEEEEEEEERDFKRSLGTMGSVEIVSALSFATEDLSSS